MSEPGSLQQVSAQARPRLPRGVRLVHNEAHGGFVLLAPERVIKADAIAAEILKRCTGDASVADIVDDLAGDVTRLLQDLADKRLLELL